jgi:anti-sigma B factor antagonist
MPDIGFPVETTHGLPVVVTPDEVDITNAARLREVLLEAAAIGHGTLVVDMSQTQFCDTAGIHALVSAYKRAQAERGEVLLVLTTPTVLRIFTLTGLDKVIPHFGSRGEAIAAAGIHPPDPGSVGRRDDRA